MSTTSLVFPICSSYIDDTKVGYTFLYLAQQSELLSLPQIIELQKQTTDRNNL